MAVFEYDKDYLRRVSEAVQTALIKASLDEKTKVVAIRSKEASDALIILVAFVVGTTPSLNTPTKVRDFCDAISDQLWHRIVAVQEAQAQGKLDFMAVLSSSNRH